MKLSPIRSLVAYGCSEWHQFGILNQKLTNSSKPAKLEQLVPNKSQKQTEPSLPVRLLICLTIFITCGIHNLEKHQYSSRQIIESGAVRYVHVEIPQNCNPPTPKTVEEKNWP
jgi:hypothetical protein